MNRTKIKGLQAFEYQHPFDRKSMVLLKRTKGISGAIKKISEYGAESFDRARLTGSGLRVTNTNFPVLYGMLVEATEILDINVVPELYLNRSSLGGYTMGVDQPCLVISHQSVDLFDEAELMFLFGHLLSYVKSETLLYVQVARWLSLLAQIGTSGPLSLVTIPINLAIGRWEKMSKYSADRAGLLCTQNTDAAASFFIKLAGQPEKLYHQIDVDEFRRQAYDFNELEYNTGYSKFVKFMVALEESHPPYVVRGAEFFKWIKTDNYENILLRKGSVFKDDRQRCSFCGTTTVGDENFCTNCGNDVSLEVILCEHCECKLEEMDRFCQSCGKPVEQDEFGDDDFV